jgi:predicted TIM-barrel fold metal-dependent hydrolase
LTRDLRIAPAILGLLFLQSGIPAPAAFTWRGDHHMHLASADLCERLGTKLEECLHQDNGPPAVYGSDVIRVLDQGSVGRGLVLSCAYLYGVSALELSPADVATWVRRENEFTAGEVARYPRRLVGFLSVDPLMPSAVEEIEHWRGSTLLVGLKLHLRANEVDLRRPEHVDRLKAVLRQAAAQQLPIAIHIGYEGIDSAATELFIREVLPAAGDSPVQIAHAAGGMPPAKGIQREVLRVFADHFEQGDSAVARVQFDLSFFPALKASDAEVRQQMREVRRIGVRRFLFASDFDVQTPRQQVQSMARLHLTAGEFRIIRNNCAPWLCSTQ